MKRPGWVPVLWVAWLVFLAVWAQSLTGKMVAFTDTLLYVFPEKWVDVDSWRRGFVPLWNTAIACGTPHLANWQAASLYPPFWLWNLTGLWDWFYYLTLMHAAWAALGFSLWLQNRGVQRPIAVLAAFAYAGSSQMVQFWGFPTHFATLAWVPWVFLATDRYLDRPSRPRWAGWVLCAAMLITAGYLHFTAYTFLFLALWILARRPSLKAWLGLAGAGSFACLLTAAHWLPAFDFMAHAYRTPTLKDVYCLRPDEYLSLLGLNLPPADPARGTAPNFIFVPSYLGWAFLIVLAAALVRVKRLKERFWLFSALGVLLWCAGIHFAPWRWIFGRFSGLLEPAKASFLWAFCACTAAATAFSQAWGGVRKRKALGWTAGILAVLLLAEIGSLPARILRLIPDPYRDPKVVESNRQLSRMAGNGRLASLREKDSPSWSDHPGVEGHFWECVSQGFPNTNAVFGLRLAGAYLSTVVDGYQNMLHYLEKGFPFEGRLLDAAGVRVLALTGRLTSIKYQVGMTSGSLLYQTNAGALPPAWRASWVKEFPDRPSVFYAMTDPDAFLEENVYTVGTPDGRAVMLAPAKRPLSEGKPPALSWWDRVKGYLKGETPSREYADTHPSPCQALWDVDFRDRGWLVYSETFLPGWHAWLDGKPAPLFLADGLFMALPVKERGRHRIVFRYEPTAFRLGLFLALAAWAGGGMAFLAWVRRQRMAVPRKRRTARSSGGIMTAIFPRPRRLP